MEKFGAFVEEGGVVLVALNDKGLRGAQLEARAEVFCDASDEEGGFEGRVFTRGGLVDPREHAGGGGFAVGSCDDERRAAAEEFFAQQCGHGGEGNALVEDALDFRIAARERVADNHEIGRGREVRFGVRLEDGDAERMEQIAHGRIGGLVGAGDAMALELEQPCKRGHGRAADADEMDMTGRRGHRVTAGSRRVSLGSSPRVSSAATPKVSVTFWCETWPERRPMAMGMSRPSRALKIARSRRSGAAPAETQSTISPKMMPQTPASLPAARNCHNMRSIW